MKYEFDYNIKTLGHLDGVHDMSIIKNEPMIFAGDLDYVKENGGQLTKMFIDQIQDELLKLQEKTGLNIVIDTRVTMTMVGSYPSIPGWHCDDVPREDNHSQPNLNLISNDVQHFMTLFSTVESQSCTEFVTDRGFTPEIDTDNVWNSLNSEVEKSDVNTRFVKTGEIIRFDQKAIHRASPTKNNGWRLFIRASITHREPYNEIRNQVQIYTPIENPGWQQKQNKEVKSVIITDFFYALFLWNLYKNLIYIIEQNTN